MDWDNDSWVTGMIVSDATDYCSQVSFVLFVILCTRCRRNDHRKYFVPAFGARLK